MATVYRQPYVEQERASPQPHIGEQTPPPQPDIEEHERTFMAVTKGMAIFAAHVIAILALLAAFTL